VHTAFALILIAACAGAELDRAAALYERTRYDEALEILGVLLNKDASALALTGKVYYGKRQYKQSVESLEQAVASAPRNSHYWDWLGKAYGRRAETSSFLTAPKYASQCRKAFEKAVELDPNNVQALTDVFSFYLNAPGFLGGGIEKAAATSERIKELDPAQYHNTQAELAKKKKDYTSAEEHLRQALRLAPGKVGPLLDLASFLAGRERYQESDELFEKAVQMAPGDPEVLFARASSFVQAKRNPDEARRLLKLYLASELTPDNPTREEAEALLDRAGGG
jgi:tetratricopeptide (TPR) repeat protein